MNVDQDHLDDADRDQEHLYIYKSLAHILDFDSSEHFHPEGESVGYADHGDRETLLGELEETNMTNNTKSNTILIVEDEESLADLYAQVLESTYTVHTAYNGEEALDQMSEEVDVVLLDRRMPDLSGGEVLNRIRQEGYACRVAMVTAVAPHFDIIEMGFDDYLTKPVDSDDLLDTVGRLLVLNSYDTLVEEYYQLASKKAALEVGGPNIDLSGNEEFTRLTDRLDELDAELRPKQETDSDLDFRRLLDGAWSRSFEG